MDYTQIISAVIALISALVSAFLIPWLKTKIDADKLQTLRTYVEIGVKAAEQLYTATDGAAKKAYVVNFLAEKGIQFDVETIDRTAQGSSRVCQAAPPAKTHLPAHCRLLLSFRTTSFKIRTPIGSTYFFRAAVELQCLSWPIRLKSPDAVRYAIRW